MYNPTLATRRLTTYMDAVRTQWPTLSAEGPPPDASTLARLDDAWLPNPTDWKKGETVRALTLAEQQLILVEVLKCKASLRYWLQHYARIKDKDGRSSLVYPLLDSQDIMLAHMAELEMQCAQGLRTDGLLLIILKSRQLGISTLTELVLLHRLLFHSNLYALIAADVEEQSANLFNMIERALRALPWWMRPRITNHVKDSELKFGDIDSLLRVTFANTTRGGTQIGLEKGQLGRGAAQPLTSKILTPNGWTTMGQLKVGDLVIGSNGKPTPVMAIYPQGKLPTYRITMSDGASTVCCGNHLWDVTVHHRAGHEHVEHAVLKTTELIAGGLRNAKGTWKYEVPLVKPVAGYSDNLPLHPYVLGALLGDGGMTQGRAYITSADEGIMRRFVGLLPESNYVVDTGNERGGRARTYRIVSRKGRHGRNPVTRALKSLGLMGRNSYTKFVPQSYMSASANDRLELLRGLLDTDGWVCPGEVGFCSTSHQLAKDVQALVRSLGGVCSMRKKGPTRNSFNPIKMRADAWCLRIHLPKTINPFGFSRKSDTYDDMIRRNTYRKIRSIEPTGIEEECQCIYVGADDHLYVTDDYILTHNTVHLFHGSEMSTWSNPGQVDDALDPAIPVSHNTFAVLESTARGRNWWHRKWLSSVAGQSRWHPVFIPWYAERRYQMPAPANWSATTMAVRHAQAVQRDSPRWCGREVTLTRDQLYFWERKYLAAQQERTLYKFLAEYASNDEECFSTSDDGFFPGEVLMDLRGKEWPAIANVVYP